MEKSKGLKVVVSFLIIVIAVVLLSSFFVRIWGGKSEALPEQASIILNEEMTIQEFGKTNAVEQEILEKVFGISGKEGLQKTIRESGITLEGIRSRIAKESTLREEYESRNWIKIPLKFALWIIFLSTVFVFIRKGGLTPKVRKVFYFMAIAVFGIILSSDPSPMGTVKDTVVLLGTKGIIFPPRIIALTVFLIMVLLANKFICSWGCQFGTLQDALFRINRQGKDRKGILPQVKLPYILTNSVRVLVFAALTLVVFAWGFDLIGAVDPFKIFHPSIVKFGAWFFIGGILLGSLFIYRPWCHLFCPFGLVGWLVEKVSLFKIQVNYDTCIACESCAKACPSSVMEAILKREKTIPDCFSCATCIGVCPTGSIRFKTGKRQKPPQGKYKLKKEEGL